MGVRQIVKICFAKRLVSGFDLALNVRPKCASGSLIGQQAGLNYPNCRNAPRSEKGARAHEF